MKLNLAEAIQIDRSAEFNGYIYWTRTLIDTLKERYNCPQTMLVVASLTDLQRH